MRSYKAHAKVNIFLKITAKRGNYHEILSRFMIVDSLYDTLQFFPKSRGEFIIDGEFDCQTKSNSIYGAYQALLHATNSDELRAFFLTHGVKVEKRIPAYAGLGGGSSNAATFLNMCNDVLSLGLSIDQLASIAVKVGADVPFFVYGYKSANVSGIGEVVERVDEELLNIKTYTPPIQISTPKVYQEFRLNHYHELPLKEYTYYLNTPSHTLLKELDIERANDLYRPACALYKELSSYQKKDHFFCGSGSSFFTS